MPTPSTYNEALYNESLIQQGHSIYKELDMSTLSTIQRIPDTTRSLDIQGTRYVNTFYDTTNP